MVQSRSWVCKKESVKMNWIKTKNNEPVTISDIPVLEIDELRHEIISGIENGDRRVILFFGDKTGEGIKLYVVMGDDETSQLYIASSFFDKVKKEYQSITQEKISLHYFEREFYEEFGINPVGHPWLKPVRYSKNRFNKDLKIENYDFYKIEGTEVHEVAVGPVHAGVIEPGHFRFNCHGEKIYNLEIQLGYQHRGIEDLIIAKMNSFDKIVYTPGIAEKIAGDTAIGHGTSYVRTIESLFETEIPERASIIRATALELERIAVHIGNIGAILNDIAFIMGSSTFGALRTVIINTTLAICGSRFGMGLLRCGGVNYDIDDEKKALILKNIDEVENKIDKLINLSVINQPSVLTRLEGTGVVDYETALNTGMVGIAARASGIKTDIRVDYPFGIYKYFPAKKVTLENGDVFARTYIRYVEIKNSFTYIRELLSALNGGIINVPISDILPPDKFTITLTEGCRGEIVHALITDHKGKVKKYKIKDPSFNNWFGLALAVRNNGISDFPICNKSFDLSYCGHDL
jgi:Ni,Fe-hydrogenase III large subunit